MRELKFRHWNTIHKDMNYKGCMGTVGNTIVQDEHNIVMQFTGVKDMNGKDIYENDILKDADGVIWEVKYLMAGFSMYCTSDQLFNKACSKENTEEEQIALDIGAWWAGTEIIGNSYENPELLKSDAQHALGDGGSE